MPLPFGYDTFLMVFPTNPFCKNGVNKVLVKISTLAYTEEEGEVKDDVVEQAAKGGKREQKGGEHKRSGYMANAQSICQVPP